MTHGTAQKTVFGLMIEGIWNAIKTGRIIILAAILALSLAFNVALVAVEAVAEVAEEVFEQLVGKPTPRAARLALAQQQVRRLGQTVAAQGRTISASAGRLQRAALAIQLRDTQMATLSRDLTTARASNAAERDRERLRAARRVRETSLRISHRIRIDALRNVGAAVGEAIPWIGIGVIAGTTALELKDACDSMRDLYELEVEFDPDAATDADATMVCGIEVPTADELWLAVKNRGSSSLEYIGSYIPDMPDVDVPFWE